MRIIRQAALTLSLMSVASSAALAHEYERATCYDAIVMARLVRQTPSVAPDCGADCILDRWPWLDVLDIKSVADGNAPTGRVTVLMMQHTYLVSSKVRRWLLRRNELDGFNVVNGADFEQMGPCRRNTAPALPYIRPTNGQTLRDLIKESEQRYGKGPHRGH